MREFMNITKALADENRVRALLALRKGELCVCQITELFGLAASTVSKHLFDSLPGRAGGGAEGGALDVLPSARQRSPGDGAAGD